VEVVNALMAERLWSSAAWWSLWLSSPFMPLQ